MTKTDRTPDALDLLRRIRQWDQLPTVADGPYWMSEIDTVLRAAAGTPEGEPAGERLTESTRLAMLREHRDILVRLRGPDLVLRLIDEAIADEEAQSQPTPATDARTPERERLGLDRLRPHVLNAAAVWRGALDPHFNGRHAAFMEVLKWIDEDIAALSLPPAQPEATPDRTRLVSLLQRCLPLDEQHGYCFCSGPDNPRLARHHDTCPAAILEKFERALSATPKTKE